MKKDNKFCPLCGSSNLMPAGYPNPKSKHCDRCAYTFREDKPEDLTGCCLFFSYGFTLNYGLGTELRQLSEYELNLEEWWHQDRLKRAGF